MTETPGSFQSKKAGSSCGAQLSVILVNYNDLAHIEASLSSLQAADLPPATEIIVVDNDSSDGSRELVASRFPRVRLVTNRENVGFPRANNQGAQESHGEFLLFLNTDTIVPPGALVPLLDLMRADATIGAAGPRLFHGDGDFQVSFGRRVDFFAQFRQKLILNPYYRRVLKKGGPLREAGWLSAACLLCRRTAFDAVGGFDDNFFLYFEDIDLCFRIREAGWRLVLVPEARVFHAGGATTMPRRSASRFEYRRSQLYFYRKHNSRGSLRLLRFYLGLNVLALAARGILTGDEGADLRRKYRRLLAGEGGPQ